jgi:hypothetical protein
MDVSGGMPAVIISMLVGSQPGKIQLLPALPAAWASGGIQGILCRGQVEIKNLQWSENSLTVSMFSEKKQMITLNLPSPIKDISILKGKTSLQKSGEQNSRNIFLPAGSEITLDVQLK